MKPIKTIYLSIPEDIGGQYYMKELSRLQESCERLGFEVYNPVTLLNEYRKILQYEPTEYHKFSFLLEYLFMSNIMIQFTEWQESFRCKTEFKIAQKVGMLILQLDNGGTVPIQSIHKILLTNLTDQCQLVKKKTC